MKHEFSNEAPIVRFAFAVAALLATLFVGGSGTHAYIFEMDRKNWQPSTG